MAREPDELRSQTHYIHTSNGKAAYCVIGLVHSFVIIVKFEKDRIIYTRKKGRFTLLISRIHGK